MAHGGLTDLLLRGKSVSFGQGQRQNWLICVNRVRKNHANSERPLPVYLKVVGVP